MPEKHSHDGDEVSDPLSVDPTSDPEGGFEDSDLHHEDDDDDDDNMAESQIKSEHDAEGKPKKKVDPKDPNRPRRKKARRACFACQKAHLTCGKFSDLSFIISITMSSFVPCLFCLAGSLTHRSSQRHLQLEPTKNSTNDIRMLR